MIKAFNRYFSVLMFFIIFSTLIVYNNKKINIEKFIENSQDCVIVLENVEEKNQKKLIGKLKKLTHQDVEIKEIEGKIYCKIRCPPDKIFFFKKWILDYQGDQDG